MIKDLKEAYSLDNLHRCWKWLNTDSNGHFKSYFRHIYRAYAISLEDNLKDLRRRLLGNTYSPIHAPKLYFPKKSGLLRPYSLLAIEDQIVYQAMVSIIAERRRAKAQKFAYKTVFGNLYAGRRSNFFYKKWQTSYKKFGESIRFVYRQGYIYTASFDLTACFDSIDHSVLQYFLLEIGLQKEFTDNLIDYLHTWTASSPEQSIYRRHGIPQGIGASGLLAEVVLSYFDEQKPTDHHLWRYFRYVDDIRFFAKNEHDLRSILVHMDILSKQIGLFPQSSKIDIHKVENVEDEIRSIMYPPEAEVFKPSPDQERVAARVNELTPQYRISDERRFKFVLGVVQPTSKLNQRLIRILERYPHLYRSVFWYFSRYGVIPRKSSESLIELLRKTETYTALTADGLRCLLTHCHPDSKSLLIKYAAEIIQRTGIQDDLFAASAAILLSENKVSFRDMEVYLSHLNWWVRSELLQYVDLHQIGTPSYEYLVNKLLKDEVADVSIVAAERIGIQSTTPQPITVTSPIEDIHPLAQTTLKKLRIINVRRSGVCPVSQSMRVMLGDEIEPIKWRSLLGTHYKDTTRKIARLQAYSETNASEWVNLLDTIHDNLLDVLFQHDPSIGKYVNGNIGGALNATSAFAQQYPNVFKAFDMIHQKRSQSPLSHPKVRRTGRSTYFIPFRFISEAKAPLKKAYLELWTNW